MLDLQASPYGTDGHKYPRHAYVTISRSEAEHLRALLEKAIVFSEDAAVDQPHLELVHRRAA
jgi:hypothetical protein